MILDECKTPRLAKDGIWGVVTRGIATMKMALTHCITETIIAAEDRKSSLAPCMGQKTETNAILKQNQNQTKLNRQPNPMQSEAPPRLHERSRHVHP